MEHDFDLNFLKENGVDVSRCIRAAGWEGFFNDPPTVYLELVREFWRSPPLLLKESRTRCWVKKSLCLKQQFLLLSTAPNPGCLKTMTRINILVALNKSGFFIKFWTSASSTKLARRTLFWTITNSAFAIFQLKQRSTYPTSSSMPSEDVWLIGKATMQFLLECLCPESSWLSKFTTCLSWQTLKIKLSIWRPEVK